MRCWASLSNRKQNFRLLALFWYHSELVTPNSLRERSWWSCESAQQGQELKIVGYNRTVHTCLAGARFLVYFPTVLEPVCLCSESLAVYKFVILWLTFRRLWKCVYSLTKSVLQWRSRPRHGHIRYERFPQGTTYPRLFLYYPTSKFRRQFAEFPSTYRDPYQGCLMVPLTSNSE